MSDIEISTAVTVTSYPKDKVLEKYFLFGGVMGGVVLIPILLVISIIEGKSFRLVDIFGVFIITIVFAIAGFIFGSIPALVTGLIICRFKIYFNSIIKIIPLFTIGFFSTFICMIWLTLNRSFIDMILAYYPFYCIGGLSAVVTGWFALPKHK